MIKQLFFINNDLFIVLIFKNFIVGIRVGRGGVKQRNSTDRSTCSADFSSEIQIIIVNGHTTCAIVSYAGYMNTMLRK